MKRLSCFILLLALVLPGLAAAAVMGNYCSAPPYVTRSIAPNIMVLMDNSVEMYGPAYTDGAIYSSTATDSITYNPANTYIGYFVPTSCYSYNSKFVESIKNAVNCTAAAPFRGNLMNWATMSKYDVLQKVLIGGNSTSKQSNANTLVSIGGAFNDKVYSGCRFEVSDANLTITEDSPGACTLLDNPSGVIAKLPRQAIPTIGELIGQFSSPVYTDKTRIAAHRNSEEQVPTVTKTPPPAPSVIDTAITAIGGVTPSSELSSLWQGLNFSGKAWAAPACGSSTVSAVNATSGVAYTLTITANCNNCSNNFTWSAITMPAWLGAPTYAGNNKGATKVSASWSGIPDTGGSFPFSATVTSDFCVGAMTSSGNISVSPAALRIVTPASTTTSLPSWSVNKSGYTFDLLGQGGTKPMTWSVTGLPAGLSWNTESDAVAGQNSYVGHITGTPTVTGDFNVTITLTDSATPNLTTSTGALALTIYPGLAISTGSLPQGTAGSAYSSTLTGVGGSAPYTWSITSGTLPTGVSMNGSGVFSGTIDMAAVIGNYPITVRLQDSAGSVVTADFTISVAAAVGNVTIATNSPLPTAYKDVPYTTDIVGVGGLLNYTWWIESGAPPGNPAMTISSVPGSRTAQLTWTPTDNSDTTYNNIKIWVRGGGGYQEFKLYSVTTLRAAPRQRSAAFNVKVDIEEETFTDLNGNDIWDLGEVFLPANDLNGNGVWDGKKGIFQLYWDEINPKARWGMTKFGRTEPDVATCMPASPVASWYTGIQNATPTDSSPLATGLYAAINYFGFRSPYDLGFRGCNNSDPIDNVPCRKNFILVISSGANVSGTAFAPGTTGCSGTAPSLVRNACFGYRTDLRTEAAAIGKQNVYTYVVNTLGTNATNNGILEAAALAGGGKYYQAANAAGLESSLVSAFQDILAQAASGTAVSVLTTSSRGIGSMVQAYFLPVRTEGTREVTWTGYTQDLWIDPKDNLREDSGTRDLKLQLAVDKVVKLFFDTATNETKVARFTTLEDGSGGTLSSCDASDIEAFSATKYLWEAGNKLALSNATRNLMTSKKVIHGENITHTFNDPEFTVLNVTGGDPDLSAALNPDATYSDENIVRYVLGEDLESGNSSFRNRIVTVGSSPRVWKLGDIISSTPKVYANTPSNTYHIDYGDNTYYNFVTGNGYKQRSSVAFVGANDGILHAFRVGYLVDKGLTDTTVKGLFKNTFASDDSENSEVGQEMWGYIPFNAFPYLKYLAHPDYCHIYFNDLSVRIVDASIGDVNTTLDPDVAKTTASWRSILVGGMRFGGACDGELSPPPPSPAGVSDVGYSAYYAIDITDPENPVPLWEFSDPDMGYSTSYPSVVRTHSDAGGKLSNGNWYIAIGSGSTQMPKSTPSTDMARTKSGYVYFIDLKTGDLVKKIELDHNAIVGDIVSIDSQKDADVDKMFFGTSYLDGTWKGKLMSLNVAGDVVEFCGAGIHRSPADCDTAQKVLFDGTFPFTASPDVAGDANGNTWLYAGAGKYVSDIDEGDVNDKLFLGLKTNLAAASYPIQVGVTAATDFIDRTNVETTGTVTSTRQECLYDSTATDKFSLQTVVTGITPDPSASTVTVPPMGWYITLPGGERVISRPLAIGGLVDFLTYKPDNDPCAYGGSSYLYAVDYIKGVAPTNVAIRAPATTNNTTTGAVTIKKGILLGPGAPPTGEAITIPPPKEGQEQLKKKIQIATGVIIEAENTPVISTISKVVHWLKK